MASESAFLRFGVETAEKYQHLRSTVFEGASNSQVFMLAMAYALASGITDPPAFQKSNTGPRTELGESDFAKMRLVQLAVTGDPNSLADSESRYEMCMRFAEAGITLLSERLNSLTTKQARKEVLGMILEGGTT